MIGDLHTHTVFSDGTDTPEQLQKAAVATALRVIAVTDHDTTAGWEAVAASRPDELTVIRGAELSTHVTAGGRVISIHLLAYLFDPDDQALSAELHRLRDDRLHRGLAIVDRMISDRIGISRQQVLDIAGAAPVGRPHIAQALIQAGLVASVGEAFASYLSSRSPYYVAKSDTPLDAAIALVRNAGGVPVIAHAGSRGAAHIADDGFFRQARDAGLLGIEVDHPDHDAATRTRLRHMAERLDLIVTGSSDYHGLNKTIRLGQERTRAAALDKLIASTSGVVEPLGPGW